MVDRVKKLVLHYRKELMAIFLFVIMFFVCSMSYAYAMSAPIPSIIITSENVTLRAKWSKIELAKSMDGVVS